MSIATAPRLRAGFLHRLHCARDGHYWERQLSEDGTDARWMCIRCGKRGEIVPIVTRLTAEPATADAEPVAGVEIGLEDAVDPQPNEPDEPADPPPSEPEDLERLEPEAHEPEPAVDSPPGEADPPAGDAEGVPLDEVDDVVHAGDVRPEHESEPEAQTSPGDEPPAEPEQPVAPGRLLTPTGPSPMTLAVIGLVVVGGAAYLAFRRRRRHRG
ncbi:MAG: LPXTG cell wall anchor domain-containing protein [Gaiellales bacterium]